MPWWSAAAAIGGALLNRKSSSDATKAANAAAEKAGQLDPRVANILFGQEGGNGGLLGRYQGMLDAPMSQAADTFGRTASNYLQNYGGADTENMRSAAYGLMSPFAAPQAQAASGTAAQANPGPHVNPYGQEVMWNKGETFQAPEAMRAAQMGAAQVQNQQPLTASLMNASQMGASRVNAPSQNNIDLRGAYEGFIGGERGNNPFLTGAIAKGINQSNNAFQNMQSDSTRNLLENVLPSIRGGAIVAGGYGGSRQGIAEGRALGDFGREQQRMIGQFGQNNTDAAVSAQAGAYDADSNRALSATQGLGAQQYGVAQQNAANAQAAAAANMMAQNQAGLANMGAQNQAASTNYAGNLSSALANAGYQQQANATNTGNQQQANSTNYAGQLQTNQANAGLLQQANLANQNAGNNASQFNAQQNQAANVANSGMVQANNQFNAGLQQQMGMANLGNQQQANMGNLQAQLGTNNLNSQNTVSGMQGLSGLLSDAYGQTQNYDNYALNQAARVNGLMQPYLSGAPTQSAQPYTTNTGGNLLGGALMGAQLANMFRGFGGSSGGTLAGSLQNAYPTGY